MADQSVIETAVDQIVIILGHLPRQGIIVPAPEPGVMRWNYPFLNEDGTVKNVTPTAAEEPIPPIFGPATAPETGPGNR